MVANKCLIFKKAPEGFPVIGEHLDLETRDFNPDTEPEKGCSTIKNLLLSFDPYQRGCMRDLDNATWAPPFMADQPLLCSAVSKVLKSNVTSFQPGDLVWGMFGAEEYSVVPPVLLPMVRKLENPLGLDLALFTGALDTSGGVGQIVGQLAKLEGLRVVGTVGSDEKLDFVINELGFDAAFNYKKEGVGEALAILAPEGLDIYYDNVGGETLDAALEHMKDFGRIVSCGMVSQYNLPQPEKYGLKNGMNIFLKRLTIQGFIISDPQFIGPYVGDFFTKMSVWLKEGKIKTKESVTVGVENAATCYLGMFKGENFGKTVLKVADL